MTEEERDIAFAERASEGVTTRETPACLRRVRKRAGRCYELAARVMLDEPGWRLFHGTLGRQGSFGHAWLERDGAFYDPVLDRWYEPADYVDTFAAKVDAIYSQREACDAMLAHKHQGPW